MTSQHATSWKPEDDGDDLHRLRDIVVEEVSLVDRAANKRRFLVVKRSGDMPEDEKLGAEVKPDGNGGLTATSVEKARKKPKDEEPDETEKARRRSAPKDGEEEDTEKARRRAPLR